MKQFQNGYCKYCLVQLLSKCTYRKNMKIWTYNCRLNYHCVLTRGSHTEFAKASKLVIKSLYNSKKWEHVTKHYTDVTNSVLLIFLVLWRQHKKRWSAGAGGGGNRERPLKGTEFRFCWATAITITTDTAEGPGDQDLAHNHPLSGDSSGETGDTWADAGFSV